ncbi:MAG: hypothetical protein QE271_12690 [Bacteriovoracaceae bacterium]|nr:hypothetical protein [Bacteriovoracaceae bacterium]
MYYRFLYSSAQKIKIKSNNFKKNTFKNFLAIKEWLIFFCLNLFFYQTFGQSNQFQSNTKISDVVTELRDARFFSKDKTSGERKLLSDAQDFLKEKIFLILEPDIKSNKARDLAKDFNVISKDKLEKISISKDNIGYWLHRYPELIEKHKLYKFNSNGGIGLLLNEVNAYSNFLHMRSMFEGKESCNELQGVIGIKDEVICSAGTANCQAEGMNNYRTRKSSVNGCSSTIPLVLSAENENNLFLLMDNLKAVSKNDGTIIKDKYLAEKEFIE